eukprot:468723-Rhodomonas_salina.3
MSFWAASLLPGMSCSWNPCELRDQSVQLAVFRCQVSAFMALGFERDRNRSRVFCVRRVEPRQCFRFSAWRALLTVAADVI